MLLHNPVETPKIADYGSLITPGREYRIRINPIITNSTESLHNVKEEDRQCAYSQDKYLRFYRTYTQRNCILECEANYTLSVCKCVPFYLPSTCGFLLSLFLLILSYSLLSLSLSFVLFFSSFLSLRERNIGIRLQCCMYVIQC